MLSAAIAYQILLQENPSTIDKVKAAGMKANGWGVAATCVNVGVNNKILAKILNGKIPHRLDAFYRVIDG
jgi:hypothetical protein